MLLGVDEDTALVGGLREPAAGSRSPRAPGNTLAGARPPVGVAADVGGAAVRVPPAGRRSSSAPPPCTTEPGCGTCAAAARCPRSGHEHDRSRPRPTPGESVWGDESELVAAVLEWVGGTSPGEPTRPRRRARLRRSPPPRGRPSRPQGIGAARGAAALRRRPRARDPRPGRPDEPRLHPVGADPRRRGLRPRDQRREHLRRRTGRRAPAPSTPRTRRWAGSSSCSAGRRRRGGRFVVAAAPTGNLSALVAARHTARRAARGARPAGRLAAGVHRRGALLDPSRRSRARRRGRRGAGGRPRPAHRARRCAAALGARPDGVVRRRGVRGHDERRHRRRPRQRRRRLRASSASGCTSTAPTAAPALAAPSVRGRVRRHRARRQLHRRPAQVAVRAVRLLRAALPRARARRAPRTRSRPATSTRSTARSGTRPTWPSTCPGAPAACRSGSAWPSRHRPLRGGRRADADTARAVADADRGPPTPEPGAAARAVGPPLRAAGLERRGLHAWSQPRWPGRA